MKLVNIKTDANTIKTIATEPEIIFKPHNPLIIKAISTLTDLSNVPIFFFIPLFYFTQKSTMKIYLKATCVTVHTGQ